MIENIILTRGPLNTCVYAVDAPLSAAYRFQKYPTAPRDLTGKDSPAIPPAEYLTYRRRNGPVRDEQGFTVYDYQP